MNHANDASRTGCRSSFASGIDSVTSATRSERLGAILYPYLVCLAVFWMDLETTLHILSDGLASRSPSTAEPRLEKLSAAVILQYLDWSGFSARLAIIYSRLCEVHSHEKNERETAFLQSAQIYGKLRRCTSAVCSGERRSVSLRSCVSRGAGGFYFPPQ